MSFAAPTPDPVRTATEEISAEPSGLLAADAAPDPEMQVYHDWLEFDGQPDERDFAVIVDLLVSVGGTSANVLRDSLSGGEQAHPRLCRVFARLRKSDPATFAKLVSATANPSPWSHDALDQARSEAEEQAECWGLEVDDDDVYDRADQSWAEHRTALASAVKASLSGRARDGRALRGDRARVRRVRVAPRRSRSRGRRASSGTRAGPSADGAGRPGRLKAQAPAGTEPRPTASESTTPECAAQLSPLAARDLTDRAKIGVAQSERDLLELYEGGAHLALGYTSWKTYWKAEFDRHPSYGYRLLDQARVARAVRHLANGLPIPNEAQTRQLKRLLKEEDELVRVWREACKTHGVPVPAKTLGELLDALWGALSRFGLWGPLTGRRFVCPSR
jgi:hypothetical protein